jgi:Domain of unknown function (DUF4114)/Secretion system C-terminal sorting domain
MNLCTKALLYSALVSTQILTAQTPTFNYLGTFKSDGTPNYLVQPSDPVPTSLVSRILASVPENYPVPKYHPEYIRAGITSDIQLRDTADVWVTFVAEGAGYLNTLGFFTYSLNAPVVRPSAVTIAFPNVSAVNSGGGLNAGDKVHLGRFPAGTGIGFVLIANGFRNGAVTNGNWILYSRPSFNPETDTTLRYHNVLLRDSTGVVVLGFEDIRRDNSGCDNDFNDALFYITSNPGTAIITDAINTTVGTSNGTSSGNNGGLESNGNLASAIATRNFQRQQMPTLTTDKMARFQKMPIDQFARGDAQNDLDQFLPLQPIEDVRPFVSTPIDLTKITNAKFVLSVDYVAGTDDRRAVVLGTKTEQTVYEHTKAVCDRLKGATLLDLKTVGSDEMPFQMATLQQMDGSLEYALSFSVLKQNDSVNIESNWTFESFSKAPNCYNFQIWSKAPHWTLKIANDIVANLTQKFILKSMKASPFPKVYVKNGLYENGMLYLNIHNPLNANSLMIKGNYTVTETSERQSFLQKVSLSGALDEKIQIPVGNIFDAGFTLQNNVDAQLDALYLADGSWGLDYDSNEAKIEQFVVNQGSNQGNLGMDNAFSVARNVEMKANVRGYASIFRALRPSGAAVDLSKFKTLSFESNGTAGVLEIILVKKSIGNWKEQYRTSILLPKDKKLFQIPIQQFISSNGNSLITNDLTSIVFSIRGNNQGFEPKQININNVVFNNSTGALRATTAATLMAYPNPVEKTVHLAFEMPESGLAMLELLSVKGQVLASVQENLQKGLNSVPFEVETLSSGVYMARVRFAGGVLMAKIVH